MTTPASWAGPTFQAQLAVQWSEGLPVQLWQTFHTLCSLSRSNRPWERFISCDNRVWWPFATALRAVPSKYSNVAVDMRSLSML